MLDTNTELVWFWDEETPEPEPAPPVPPRVDIDNINAWGSSGLDLQDYTGEKFLGGFGNTKFFEMDYWTLRARSEQLFTENLYAKGLIRRLATNIITTGLTPELAPNEKVLGLDKDSLVDWADDVEDLFTLYTNVAGLCDYTGQRTYGQIQYAAYIESVVAGDVLNIIRMNPETRLPQLQVVSGSRVQSPADTSNVKKGHKILHGVELDAKGAQVAYWHRNDNDEDERIAAFGKVTGRRVAWLQYGLSLRLDDVRGMPLLAIYLQSLKEIDRYRDSTLRKADINASLAMVVEKTEEKMGSRSMSAGAALKTTATVTDTDGSTRTRNLAKYLPGMIIEEGQFGEKITPFSTQGTDVNFGEFEAGIIQSIAWCEEMPPSIVRLSFSSNYAASAGEVNELKIFQNRERTRQGSENCRPYYQEWFISMVLVSKVIAKGFLEACDNPQQWDKKAAWLVTEWSGAIKLASDLGKLVKAYSDMVDKGFITHARATKELTGMKWRDNMKRLAEENKITVEANKPLTDLAKEQANPPQAPEGKGKLALVVDSKVEETE